MKKTLRLLCCICAFSLIESIPLKAAWWPFGGKSKTVKEGEQTKKKPWYKKLNPFKKKKKKSAQVNQDMAEAAAATGGATAAMVQDTSALEKQLQKAVNRFDYEEANGVVQKIKKQDPARGKKLEKWLEEKKKKVIFESSKDIQEEFENAIRNHNKAKASQAIEKMPDGSEQVSAAYSVFVNTFSGRTLNVW